MKQLYTRSLLVSLCSWIIFFTWGYSPLSASETMDVDTIALTPDKTLPYGDYLTVLAIDELNAAYFIPKLPSSLPYLPTPSGAHQTSPLWQYFVDGGMPSQWRSKIAEYTYTTRLLHPLSVDSIRFESPKAFVSTKLTGFNPKLYNRPTIHLKGKEDADLRRQLYQSLFLSSPSIYAYTSHYLRDYLLPRRIERKEPPPILIDTVLKSPPKPPTDDEGTFWPKLRLPPRKYWIQTLESTLQISQNYVSNNWYKGGASNLNLFSREFLQLEYNRGNIRWVNELESKLNIYNASGDSLRSYRTADDLLRLRTNYGYKAFSRWYYTIDTEARTQLFNAYKPNTRELQAAPLAPLHIDIGLGMKYDLVHKSKVVYGRSTKFSLNIAPFSYNFHLSTRRDVDLVRHGFPPGRTMYYTFGSSIKAELNHRFNMNVSLQSRLYVTTTYSKWLGEWENALNMSFSRYFSTRLYIYLRYDDSAPPTDTFGKFFQLNELLSIGFNYRW